MRALVLYNRYSGKSKVTKKLGYICEQLKTKYAIVECFQSTHQKSITDHIIKCEYSYDLIVIVGGDGSVNEVVNGIMQVNPRPTLAYIPMGTCNDAASTLGLERNIKKTMKIILAGRKSKIDVFKINNAYFTYAMAAGCLTEISYDAPHKIKKNIGKLAYYIQGLKSFKETKTIQASIEGDNQHLVGDYSLLLALNTRYLAGFKIHRKRNIYLNDGKLRVTLIIKTSKLMNVIDFGMFLLFGEAYHHNIINFDSTKLKVKSNSLVAFNTDGEQFEKTKEVKVEVVPKAIEIIVSKRVYHRHFRQINK